MNILVLGKDGQLGTCLIDSLKSIASLTALGRNELDLEDAGAIQNILGDLRPDIIFNAAAYTAVDAAEDNKDTAWRVNATAPGIIGNAAAVIDATVIHFSTDYVFDGSLDRPYREQDATAPINAYGESKLAGEQALRASGARSLVFRISWVYAEKGKNFLTTILRLANDRDRLDIVSDQHGAPTSAGAVAVAMRQLVEHHGKMNRIINEDSPPVIHLACQGTASWFDFASTIINSYAQRNLTFKVPALYPMAGADYPSKARRPMNSRLDTSLAKQWLGLTLPEWHKSLETVISKVDICA